MARFWFIEGHVDLEYAPKKQKQTIAPKSPTKIIYVIMIYSYKRNPTKKPIHTTHTHNNLHISSKKSNKWKKTLTTLCIFHFKKATKNRRNRAASHLRLSIPTFWSQVTLPFRPDFFSSHVGPGVICSSKEKCPLRIQASHTDIKSKSPTPRLCTKKAGTQINSARWNFATFEPLSDFSGMVSFFREGMDVFWWKFDRFASDELES